MGDMMDYAKFHSDLARINRTMSEASEKLAVHWPILAEAIRETYDPKNWTDEDRKHMR